jgi:hypothetical protein
MKLSNRFTLLAFGVIGLSALAASPAAAQFTEADVSACRSASGVVGARCLSARSEINNTKNGSYSNEAILGMGNEDAHAGNSIRPGGDNDPNPLTRGTGSIETTGGGTYNGGIPASRLITYIKSLDGGNGGATGKLGSRQAPPAPTRTSVAATPTYSTTKTKTATGQNVVINDHRNPAGAAPKPNSPPPAAAIGSTTNTASAQSTQTSMARDHRHQ